MKKISILNQNSKNGLLISSKSLKIKGSLFMYFGPKIQNLTIKHMYIYEENLNFKPKFKSWTSQFVPSI